MTSTFILQRHVDHSGVSGTGVVAEGAEFSDGSVVLRWPGEHPSTATWGDMRDMEAIHGHDGDTVVQYSAEAQLLAWYERLCRYLCSHRRQPVTCGPHPDLPGRIRLTFNSYTIWRFWIGLLDGSTDASIQEVVSGELVHRWATPDGLVWLTCYLPHHEPEAHPLEIFDREDR